MRILDEPKVFLIGQPAVDKDQMRAYLREIHDDEGRTGEAWVNRLEEKGLWDTLPDAALLTEFFGRLCYKSWDPGLNKNVTRIREDHDEYILNILRTGHGSILHHAMLNFVIRGGSRVFTAEMNRHQVGVGISEQSLRYVRLDDIEFWEPTALSRPTLDAGQELVEAFEQFYLDSLEREGLNDPNMPFSQKKIVTSALRRWAPLGLATEEGWSANIRTLRHVIEMRTDTFAEEEIRLILHKIGLLARAALPSFFGDYKLEPADAENALPPDWQTDFRKV